MIRKSETILALSGKSMALLRPARAAMRDVSRSSRSVVRVAMDACGVRLASASQAKTPQRTTKSCGPGAATVASIPAGLCWRDNGDNQRRSPGRARISRKAIARGRPGCPGCTCQSRVRLFTTHCTRCCGCRRRPVFPAPSDQERVNVSAKPGQNRAAGMFPCAFRLAPVLMFQRVGTQRYFDAAGFPGRTLGLEPENGKTKTAGAK